MHGLKCTQTCAVCFKCVGHHVHFGDTSREEAAYEDVPGPQVGSEIEGAWCNKPGPGPYTLDVDAGTLAAGWDGDQGVEHEPERWGRAESQGRAGRPRCDQRPTRGTLYQIRPSTTDAGAAAAAGPTGQVEGAEAEGWRREEVARGSENAGKNKDELRRLLSRVDDDGDEYATSTSTAEDGPFFLGFCIHWILNARYPGIPWVGYADDSAGEPAAL